MTCVVANGPQAGWIVSVSADGMVHESGPTLAAWFEAWFGHHLAHFRWIREAMDRGDSAAQIAEAARARDLHRPEEYAGSIANMEAGRLSSGNEARAWLEEVLRIYRERRGSSPAS